MKKQNRRGNLFTLLLRNYIAFTILVTVIFIAAILLAVFGNELNLVDFEQIADYKEALASGQYDEFPTERLLGKDGKIAVLDENGQTVYDPGKKTAALSAEEVEFIPNALSDSYIDTREIETNRGTLNYEITITSEDFGKNVFIMDENYKVIYSSNDQEGTQLSEKKYLLLSNRFFEGYTVNRYPFQSEDGGNKTLLLFRREDADLEELKKIGEMAAQFVFYFILFYVILIVLLIIWLRKKINQPLKLLCGTIEGYHIGKPISQDYAGPKEFVDIFDNFSLMAHRLEESEEQKKALEENRRKLIADISHDLKTPIAVIQGYAKAVADGIIPQQDQKKYLSIIDQKAAGLNELILTFHEYSKLEHPEFRLDLKETDICNYFRDFVAEQYFELETAGFQVEADVPERHVFCQIDGMQLKRALSNIVGNAVKHTKEGTRLYFGLAVEEEHVVLTLADDGDGIPPEIAEHIFAPFTKGDSARTGGGSGLGLSIAKKIIEAHGGTIELLSKKTYGKTAEPLSTKLPGKTETIEAETHDKTEKIPVNTYRGAVFRITVPKASAKAVG